MDADLRELIRDAKRELRKSSGLPLTAEEQAEERRITEMQELENFLFDKLRVRLLLPLKGKFLWTEKGAAAQFMVGDAVFYLRRDRNLYRLYVVENGEERELAQLDSSDPQFANRFLVAIGEASVFSA